MMGASPTETGLSQAETEVSALRASIPSAGVRSLQSLGVNYYYDAEDWEATYPSDDLDAVNEWVQDEGWGRSVYEIQTLIDGPKLYAAHYPISWVPDSDPGDIDDWEVRFFASPEAARAAVASAIEARRAATAETGAVHESAVPQGDAQTQSEQSK